MVCILLWYMLLQEGDAEQNPGSVSLKLKLILGLNKDVVRG